MRTAFGTAASLLLALVLWVAFAPPSLGGHMTMLVVNGNSMEPGMHRGDVVFVSNLGRPTVGEIAAYRSPELGVVIHRVIGDDGTRLTLQGDNRETVDTYKPSYDEIVGGVSFMVPNGITYLQFAANPRVVIAITLLTMLGGAAASKRTRRALHRASKPFGTPATASGIESLSFTHPSGIQVASAAAIALVGAAGLLMLVRSQGFTAPASDVVAFSERGNLTYSGDVPSGLYDDNRLTAPQPIIRGATKQLDVAYDYQLAAGQDGIAPERVSGTYSLWAELRHETGWQRVMNLRPATPFTGSTVHAAGSISLAQVDVLASQLEQALKIQEGLTTYTLRVVADVHATGTTAGIPFERHVEQTMQFAMNNRALSLDTTVGKTTLQLDEKPTVQIPTTTERHLAVPMTGLSFAHRELPMAAWIAVGTSAIVLLLGAASTMAVARMGEADRIRVRYGQQIIDVADGSNAVPENALFVKRFQDLLTIAAAEGTTIGHLVDNGINVYVVRTMNEAYVYWVVPTTVEAPEAAFSKVEA